jgi:hypothetical protein
MYYFLHENEINRSKALPSEYRRCRGSADASHVLRR